MVVRWLVERLGPGAEPAWRENLVAFRRVVLVHVAARSLLSMGLGGGVGALANALYGLTVVAALLGLARGLARRMSGLCLTLVLAETVRGLPFTANHVALEALVLALLALLDERDEAEGALLLASLRWSTAVMFLYTGLQKLWWGYWSQGEMLAYLTATEERFALALGRLLPAEELARLRSFNESLIAPGRWQPRIGAGPYRVDSAAWVVLSNGVWLFELAAGLALCVRKLFVPAALASLLVVAFIELGARELTFGLLMANLLLLFLPGAWNRRLWPLSALAYAWLAAAHAGLVPMFAYSPA